MSTVLVTSVVIYLAVSILIGLYAATRVHSARDYITAGRSLPMFVVIAMVFATWFGAETVLGIPATFLDENLAGTISDPFGASLCLILFGLVFARPLYRYGVLTLGDFYRRRFNRPVELVVSAAIALSYLGWVSAQVTALGLVFNVLSEGVISHAAGIVIGAAVVLVYTLLGGMWSVALTTVVQMTIIVVGLLWISVMVADMPGVDGVAPVVEHAATTRRSTSQATGIGGGDLSIDALRSRRGSLVECLARVQGGRQRVPGRCGSSRREVRGRDAFEDG
jgi:Na+/proline symporter